MSRLKKQERQKQLTEKLNITPFLTDEELASHFGVSVPTIRLDRLELGIPELRERIKAMATEHAQDEQPEPIHCRRTYRCNGRQTSFIYVTYDTRDGRPFWLY